MPVTQPPLHRSVHAELPHTALASGRDDQTLVRVIALHTSCGTLARPENMKSGDDSEPGERRV